MTCFLTAEVGGMLALQQVEFLLEYRFRKDNEALEVSDVTAFARSMLRFTCSASLASNREESFLDIWKQCNALLNKQITCLKTYYLTALCVKLS